MLFLVSIWMQSSTRSDVMYLSHVRKSQRVQGGKKSVCAKFQSLEAREGVVTQEHDARSVEMHVCVFERLLTFF